MQTFIAFLGTAVVGYSVSSFDQLGVCLSVCVSTLDVRLRLTASVTRDTFIFAINKDRADHGWLVSRSNHAETRLVTNQRLHSVRVHRTEGLAYCSGTAIHARTTHCSLTIYGQGFRSTRCYPPAEAKGGYERERERELLSPRGREGCAGEACGRSLR